MELLKKSEVMNEVIPKERQDIYQVANQIDFIKQNEDNIHLNRILKSHLDKIEKLTMNVNQYAALFSGFLDFFNMFAQNIIILVFYYLYVNNKMYYEQIFTISIILAYFLPAIMEIVAVNINLRDLKSANNFIKFVKKEKEPNGDIVIDHIQSIQIHMRNLYSSEGAVLARNVELTAKPGDVIGIIGETGSGKSTLVKSLVKFWTKNKEIEINNQPIEMIENSSLRRKISFYSQNMPIISGDMEENLMFGKEKGKIDRYKNIDFLEKFEGKNITENGNNLSGGDKQKIMLARAYFDEADVMIFDEPTSSLDSQTEKEILDKILRQESKIIILITHKKDNLKYCNKVYEIANKKLLCSKQ